VKEEKGAAVGNYLKTKRTSTEGTTETFKEATTMSMLLSYKAKWDMDTHTGQIEVKLWAGTLANPQSTFTATLLPQTPEEMSMLVDLLRNEKPLDYNTSTKELRLGEWEVTGEGES
jgi:hypothetical protein